MSATPAVPLPDSEVRKEALNTKQSCIVEAPAGSGKTGLLIQRYLKLLATVDHPDQVLALTFTRKATGEMRERVTAALHSAAQAAPLMESDFAAATRKAAIAVLQRDAEQQWRLHEQPHLLNIRTFDSLCSSIARSAPLLSGSVATTTPVEDAEPLYLQAAHAVMLQLGGDDQELSHSIGVLLRHRDGDLKQCEHALAEMLGSREQWGHLLPLGAELDEEALQSVVLPKLNAALQRAQCAALKRLHSCFPEQTLQRLALLAQELAFAEGYKDHANEFAPCAQLSHTPGFSANDLDHWLIIAKLLLTESDSWRKRIGSHDLKVTLQKEQAAELKDLLVGLQTEERLSLLRSLRTLPPVEYPAEQWHVAKALFRLLQQALIELQLLFVRDSVCDFAEVALAARVALQASDLQVALGAEVRHLLVDEMQDSSTGQYGLLETLTEGWDGTSQTIFLVGDPKQSIYLFRQARVERFQQCMAEGLLGDIRLKPLLLSANFRSGQALVAQFNGTFEQVFPVKLASEGDIVFTPADAVLTGSTSDGVCWHGRLLQPATQQGERVRQRHAARVREAQEIADVVQHERSHRANLAIAVLTRARTHVVEVAKVFAQRGIPYRAVGIDALGDRQEVLDALSITRALMHPADRTAWLAILRAPWCGLGLADLHMLAGGDQSALRNQPLRPQMREYAVGLQPTMRTRVEQTLDVMDAALQHTGVEALSQRVERTWYSLGGDRCTNSAGRRNVLQFLRLLDSMASANEAITVHTLERRLKRLYAEPSADAGAVDIMTIHKAKGLEWDVVLVPGMHRGGAQDSTVALNWLELPGRTAGDDIDVLLAPLPEQGEPAAGLYSYIASIRKRRTHAELKRLLYVAATRARSILHLFATPDADRSGAPSIRPGTLLHALGPASANFFHAAEQAAEQSLSNSPLTLAAAATDFASVAEPPRTPTIERLSTLCYPLVELQRRQPDFGLLPSPVPSLRSQPQGSFGARVVGTTIHSFVERLAHQLRDTASPLMQAFADASQGLAAWAPAIAATLRAGGLPSDEVTRATRTVLRALQNLLMSAVGQWLLSPHKDARSEEAWHSTVDNDLRRLRLDMSFFAGSTPFAAGSETLWIIDFKTSDRAAGQQNTFLHAQMELYRGQLEGYGYLRKYTLPTGTPIMLALSYPLMDRFVYWPLHGGSPVLLPPAEPDDKPLS